MKAIGIIAEYNPCHTGHSYQISESKKQLQADCVVAVMSGNFVQRGEPAILDKYTRTKLALASGADLVLELPITYAVDGAARFAQGGIATLNLLPSLEAISFGMEADQLEPLNHVAEFLHHETPEYQEILQKYLKSGEHMGLARMHALEDTLQDNSLSDILSTPNNILAIEYLLAMKKQQVAFKPFGLKRIGAGYHATNAENGYASATMIRNALLDSQVDTLQPYFTERAFDILKNVHYSICSNDFSQLLNFAILNKDDFSDILDIDTDLSHRICALKRDGKIRTYTDWVNDLKTKDITQLHLQRALLHILLGITKDMVTCQNSISYLQVLGMNKTGQAYLHEIKKQLSVPMITEASSAMQKLDSEGKSMFHLQVYSTELYRNVVFQKYNVTIPDEYRSKPIFI